jgi:Big-like domain-containing protein
MLRISPFIRVLTCVGILSVIACAKAPFSIPEVDLTTLRIDPPGGTLQKGHNLQLRAFIDDAANRNVNPSQVVWKSSAPSTVSVTDDGVAQGLAAGQATISAEFQGFVAFSSLGVVDAAPNCVTGLQVPVSCEPPTLTH